MITPDLELVDNFGETGCIYDYILVWNGMILDDNVGFADIVRDHGMSETEPNDITVVKRECPKMVTPCMWVLVPSGGSENEDT